MTGELLHETVLPVLPDFEEGIAEAPIVHDICIDYDGTQQNELNEIVDNMAYIGCQDGSIRCMVPSGKDIELENYIICKPHSDCVKKVSE